MEERRSAIYFGCLCIYITVFEVEVSLEVNNNLGSTLVLCLISFDYNLLGVSVGTQVVLGGNSAAFSADFTG